MTSNDGRVHSKTTVVDHEPAAQHWNLVILADGYRTNELGKYASDVQNFVNTLRDTQPFKQVWDATNVYRIDVSSTDSGADDPTRCGGTGEIPRTYFDASFCHNGVELLLVVDDSTAITVANQQVPEWDVVIVIVNSQKYGGSGGSIAVFSIAEDASEISLHEMGHTAFGLTDSMKIT